MARRRGLQAEVLISLALMMGTATAVLVVLLVRTHDIRLQQVRGHLVHGLLEEARSPLAELAPVVAGTRWWNLGPRGELYARGRETPEIDAESRALADEARTRDAPVLRSRLPWEPIRFAVPQPGGLVAVAWIPPSIPGGPLLALFIADLLVLTGFGTYILRARFVRPLEKLAAAARQVADGDLMTRVEVDGASETTDLAGAFNDMTESLDRRARALEKAVVELRESNAELRDARAGLHRNERLAAVGSLAAGVAHEVGNPMGAILAFLDLIGRDSGLSEDTRRYVDRTRQEGERVRVILRRLLDFSRPSVGVLAPVDVAAACEETAALIRAQRRYAGVEIQVDRHDDAPLALVDRGALAQIILNLLLNAADALAERADSARIRVAVAPAWRGVRAGDAPGREPGRPADLVDCRVSDNGPGIPEADRERIFDPFYTTKPPGEGTGLGLSNAVRLAEESGGRLDLADSEAGEGAVFTLRLPAALAGGSGSGRVRGEAPS